MKILFIIFIINLAQASDIDNSINCYNEKTQEGQSNCFESIKNAEILVNEGEEALNKKVFTDCLTENSVEDSSNCDSSFKE
jgi:hypothetical protein